ncbi:MAG TPA: CinA family protein [Alphaproteobacteria bacterium]|nr:CinA family protein [Alphaproteobacteria bacterium]
MVFPDDLVRRAEGLISTARAKRMRVATAESCTGGLVSALLTEIPGSSDVVECCFVTYSNQAKTRLLGVSSKLIASHGAVSPEVARAMAEGALEHSAADLAVSITGVAGPGGGSAEKPVGLVELACAARGRGTILATERFADLGRSQIRLAAVGKALWLFERFLAEAP